MRKLTAAEVTFEVTIEAEEMPVRRGHFASGDAEQDKADEDAIIRRLDRGEVEAWCGVVVTATWEAPDGTEYMGRDSLWGCSLDDSYTAEVVAEHHGMREQALDDLNQVIACSIGKAKRLEAALS
jgi:hypothetical protein